MSRKHNHYIGEFERLVLLAVLQLRDDGGALEIRKALEEQANRKVARGALYATLERLTKKGLLDWIVESATPPRGGLPRRHFAVTKDGLIVLRTSRRAVANLSRGLDEILGKS